MDQTNLLDSKQNKFYSPEWLISKIVTPAGQNLSRILGSNVDKNFFLSFILACLEYNPQKRLKPIEAFLHPFLQPLFPFNQLFGTAINYLLIQQHTYQQQYSQQNVQIKEEPLTPTNNMESQVSSTNKAQTEIEQEQEQLSCATDYIINLNVNIKNVYNNHQNGSPTPSSTNMRIVKKRKNESISQRTQKQTNNSPSKITNINTNTTTNTINTNTTTTTQASPVTLQQQITTASPKITSKIVDDNSPKTKHIQNNKRKQTVQNFVDEQYPKKIAKIDQNTSNSVPSPNNVNLMKPPLEDDDEVILL